MNHRKDAVRIHPLWWTAMLFVTVAGLVVLCLGVFAGTFRSYVPVTLTSDRVGLVMETGAKVKLRGVEVGRVAGLAGGGREAGLELEIYPDQLDHIPANVGAEIAATTAFGAKFVDLIYPRHPSTQRLAAGATLRSRNVTAEINTVFDNLVGLLEQIDVTKLSSVLTALADGVRGQGERMGQATTDADRVLSAINPKMDTVAADWRAFKGFSDAYAVAAKDILFALDAASTTSTTIAGHSADLDVLLLNTIGFADTGTEFLATNRDNLIEAVNVLEPTTSLLLKYDPVYTCLLQGAQFYLENGGYDTFGGNGRGFVQDATVALGDDPYRYPDHLPTVAAKGGPGGKPSCGSLPDVSKNYPVRYLVTDTGFGGGLDVRPNPGIGFPGFTNYFPVTKAIPEPPKIRHPGGPAPGPLPPPAGAPLPAADSAPMPPPPPAPQ